jgi:hypothetical protein
VWRRTGGGSKGERKGRRRCWTAEALDGGGAGRLKRWTAVEDWRREQGREKGTTAALDG